MTKPHKKTPREEIQTIREHIVSVATDHASEVHGRLQLWFSLFDSIDGTIEIGMAPIINKYPWPQWLVEKLQRSPIGQVETNENSCYLVYYLPIETLPLKFQTRRDEAVKRERIRKRSRALRYEWMGLRNCLTTCRDHLLKRALIKRMWILKLIEFKLSRVQAEIEKLADISDAIGCTDRAINEALFKDIALFLGIEEGNEVALICDVKDLAYSLPIRRIPYEPRPG